MKTPLPPPCSLHKQIPLLSEHQAFVAASRHTAKEIFLGEDERLVLVVGPCSIHNEESALEYASHLLELSQLVKKHFFILMRVFIEKPRTQFGWKGFLYDPLLDGSYDIKEGLKRSRNLLVKITELGLPIATEFLDPFIPYYYQDLISWGFIGARTTASQIHRQMASYLTMPIGFKNEVDGSYTQAIHGSLAARHPQTSIGINDQGIISSINSSGNPYTHLVLRGAFNHTNYDALSVSKVIHKQRLFGMNSRLMIDCAHGNSQKNPKNQRTVFDSVLEQIQAKNYLIMGVMIESHLQGGNILSITDPCLDWNGTKELILSTYRSIQSRSSRSKAAVSTLQ